MKQILLFATLIFGLGVKSAPWWKTILTALNP